MPGPGQYVPPSTEIVKKRAPGWRYEYFINIDRMGSERRIAPGTENKHKIAVPGPTKYELPSLVILLFDYDLDK